MEAQNMSSVERLTFMLFVISILVKKYFFKIFSNTKLQKSYDYFPSTNKECK